MNIFSIGLKLFDQVSEEDDRFFKWLTPPMVDLGMYKFEYLNIGHITTEELFMNDYAEDILELEQVCTSTKQLHVTLDAKYVQEDLNKVMKNQCQHLTEAKCNELLKLLQNSKIFLTEKLAPGKQIQYTSN